MNFNVYNSLILAGVIQGLIFGVVVLQSKKYNHKSVYFLAGLIMIYSVNNLQWYFEDIGQITLDTLYRYYHIPISNLVAALIYLFVITYLYPERPAKKTDIYLFIPFALSLSLSILYKILIAQGQSGFTNGLRSYIMIYDELVSAIFHIVVYVLIFKEINVYTKRHRTFSKTNIVMNTGWLKITMYAMFVLTALWIVLNVLYVYFPGQISFYPLWIAIAITIYWLGHIGIYKYGIIEQRKQIRNKQVKKDKPKEEGTTKHIIIERLKSYLVDERQFLDPDLNLEKTAKALEISQGHLSKTINTELGIGFKDYINSLRVAEAKSYLLDSEFSNYTLVAIGLEAGFNSKSAFNSSFKKITGVTPSQFKKRQGN